MGPFVHRGRQLAAKVARRARGLAVALTQPTENERLVERALAANSAVDMQDRVVAITGSTRGVGLAVARAMAGQGARVVVNGRNPGAVQAVVGELQAAGRQVAGVAADVSTPEGARAVVAAAFERFGRLDVLVNNAGYAPAAKAAWEVSPEDLETTLRVNVVGPYLCSRAAIEEWRARAAEGRIINVSSGAGLQPFPKLAPYGVSKFGLEGLTRYLAADLGWDRITVTGLQLGSLKTEMTRKVFDWADYELLPDCEVATPAFLFAATAPAATVHGRSFAVPRLIENRQAEAILAGPLSTTAEAVYKPIVVNGEEVERTPARFELFDRAENHYGQSPRVDDAIRACLGESPTYYYPDENYTGLRRRLAAEHGIDESAFVFGSGSWTLIDELLRLFCKPGEEVISNLPGWFGFHMLCPRHAIRNRRVPLSWIAGNRHPHHNLDGVLAAIGPETRMIYLISPSNPEGIVLSESDFAAFLAKVPETIPVVVDEAYVEYADRPDIVRTAHWSQSPDRIVIGLRTFSKFYGLAGLRLGYAFARPDVARLMRKQSLIFSVSRIAERAGVAALDDEAHRRRVHEAVAAERRRMLADLDRSGIPAIPSEAPFMLVEAPCAIDRYLAAYGQNGIVMPPYLFHDKYVMFPVGRPEQNDRNLKILKSLSST